MRRIAVFVAVFALALPLYAADGGPGKSVRRQAGARAAGEMDMERWRSMTPDQRVMEVVNAMFERYDLNGDGVLDKKEALAMMKERAKALAEQQRRMREGSRSGPGSYPPLPWYE